MQKYGVANTHVRTVFYTDTLRILNDLKSNPFTVNRLESLGIKRKKCFKGKKTCPWIGFSCNRTVLFTHYIYFVAELWMCVAGGLTICFNFCGMVRWAICCLKSSKMPHFDYFSDVSKYIPDGCVNNIQLKFVWHNRKF